MKDERKEIKKIRLKEGNEKRIGLKKEEEEV